MKAPAIRTAVSAEHSKEVAKANIVRLMDSESLGRYVAEQTAGVFHRLTELRPFYEELWKRFEKLQKGETIMGCRNRSEYATKVLGRSMRSIQYALYSRRPLQSKIENLTKGFVPRQWVKENARAIKEIIDRQREADANDPELQDFVRRVEEAKRQRAAAPAPEPDFFPNAIPGKRPPAADLKEVLKLARQGAAKIYHPDLPRGNPERMAALNAAVDWLESVAGA